MLHYTGFIQILILLAAITSDFSATKEVRQSHRRNGINDLTTLPRLRDLLSPKQRRGLIARTSPLEDAYDR